MAKKDFIERAKWNIETGGRLGRKLTAMEKKKRKRDREEQYKKDHPLYAELLKEESRFNRMAGQYKRFYGISDEKIQEIWESVNPIKNKKRATQRSIDRVIAAQEKLEVLAESVKRGWRTPEGEVTFDAPWFHVKLDESEKPGGFDALKKDKEGHIIAPDITDSGNDYISEAIDDLLPIDEESEVYKIMLDNFIEQLRGYINANRSSARRDMERSFEFIREILREAEEKHGAEWVINKLSEWTENFVEQMGRLVAAIYDPEYRLDYSSRDSGRDKYIEVVGQLQTLLEVSVPMTF